MIITSLLFISVNQYLFYFIYPFVLLFRFHIQVIIECLHLSDISPSIIFSRSIHVVANGKILFFLWLSNKKSYRKTSISALLTMPKPLTVWITINCGNSERWEYQTTWPASWETCMQVRKQQLELDMELPPNKKRSMSRLYIVTLFI